ncbi:UDP-forming cellulose synthase catalytic subunit [Phenylobacterium immobile]|uniref:UDP-forming cellulose synthase catalytic subunit n=1 Tax=Phenylobacterium immobile TaxID=21 RepID=UPI000AC67F56|nr:UDP-forming cellulose synthase catalytic subunit [Phenylobacterium immobile]
MLKTLQDLGFRAAATRPVQIVALIAATALVLMAVAVPLDRKAQMIFGLAIFAAAALIAQRSTSRRMTMVLVVISTVLSTRYIWWRVTETLHFDNPLAMFLGIGLFMAELYAWAILVFGYIQCVWPLERRVREIEGDPSTWPTVDIYIPTYNESLDIVTDTVFAAMDQDYPHDRFKVYILDDGRREEFRAFAEAVGVGYITRDNNEHAKAGNMNQAMPKTTGELICIFDCDHVATRAFLQFTVGWFQAEPKLALLQTPHYFYSPDPVQRNVVAVKDIPGEGDLFYGVVQKGNDFWNAAFFCGSCAIIRREALMATNGFAGETVTEDAHTALKLQRMGWSTAYLNARLSAGLATERLTLHVGQRARWARGMTQIFRIDNPMLGPGLSFGQRICYLNAMLHFQFPLPRIVFLTSPLAYLLMGQNIIAASALTILAFAGPHLLFAILVNERVQGKYRRAFWGEVYEALISFHLVGPTLLPLIDPKKGKFNVTDKGGLLEEGFFDYKVLAPHLICVSLLILGIGVGVVKLLLPNYFESARETIILNVTWTFYSLLILLTALAVGRETRQIRSRAHLEAELPIRLYFEDGHAAEAISINLSMGGMAVRAEPELVEARTVTHVEVMAAENTFGFPVEMLESRGGRLRLRFTDMSLDARRQLVRVVMGRADAWPAPEDLVSWSAWQSFLDLCRASFSIVFWWRLDKTPRRQDVMARFMKRTAAVIMVGALGLAAFAGFGATTAHAQAAAPPVEAAAAPAAGGQRRVSMTLEDLKQTRPMRLTSTLGEASVPFTVRQDEVVTQAQLTLNFAYSPQLLQDLSHLTVLINDEVIGTIPLLSVGAGGVTVVLPIDPGLLTADNRLGFRFIGHYTRACEDPLHSTLWANVSNTRSRLDLTFQKLSLGDTLTRLPAPFFDTSDQASLTLPFVFAGQPSNQAVQAASAVASYFGMSASFRGFKFPVLINALPSTDAVVIARNGAFVGEWSPPPSSGPTIRLVRNPRNPYATLLVVTGGSDEDVLAAARVLAAAPKSLSGAAAQVSAMSFAKRKPYDAPRWVDTRRPVRLGDLVSPTNLEGLGLRPGLLTAEFKTAPDLFFWPQTGAKVSFGYRYPGGTWLDYNMSRLDILTNDKYIRSVPLRPEGVVEKTRDVLGMEVVQQKASVELPGYNIFGQNQLQFFYDLHVNKKGACQGEIPTGVRTGIDADSKLDLTHAHHFSRMPDLAFFASAGFPFTRMADLSETVAIIPANPQATDLEALLVMMGRLGDATGAPALAVTVARPGEQVNMAGHDILVIGPMTIAQQAGSLFQSAPIRVEGSGMRVAANSMIDRLFARFGSNVDQRNPGGADEALVSVSDIAGVTSWRSPFDNKRVVVAMLAASSARLPEMAYALARPAANASMQGDLSIASGLTFNSYRVSQGFWSGELPWHISVMWWASRNPIMLALGLLAAATVFGLLIWAVMSALERVRLRDVGGDK